MPAPDPSPFALFLSCNPDGGLVARYGTRTFLGADRDATNPSRVKYYPERVVAVSVAEYRRFRREYNRAMTNGSVVRRTAAEWIEQNKPPEPAAPLPKKRKARSQ